MQKIMAGAPLVFALAVALFSAGCPIQPESEILTFVAVDQDARNRGENLRVDLNSAVVHHSQRTGQISGVESGILYGTTGATPLGEAFDTSPQSRAAALTAYFTRNASAYGLTNARDEIRIPETEVAEVEPSNEQPDVLVTQAVQTNGGVPIMGREAVGIFDPQGHLLVVLSRVLPSVPLPAPTPAFDAESAWSQLITAIARNEHLTDGDSRLHWLGLHAAAAEHRENLQWRPSDMTPMATLTLVYVIDIRFNLDSARIIMDAETGDILSAVSTTPSDWWVDGATVLALRVPNEIGRVMNIPSTREGDTLYMGLNSSALGGSVFRPGEVLSIDNSLTRPDRSLTYFAQMTTMSASGWAGDPTYTGLSRSATSLMKNMVTTLNWWSERRWRSWDGRGSTMWASVMNSKTADGSPELNAWGGGGVMQYGDGTYSNGETTASSVEVVGHEFMHSVVGATSALEYYQESGAISEALSDLFGAALSARGDRYNNAMIGEPDGDATINGFRDMSRRRSYYDYWVTEADSGGVHTNSGILNFPHYVLVNGGNSSVNVPVELRRIPAYGVAKVEELIRLTNRYRIFPPRSSLEEFARSVESFCRLLAVLRGSRSGPDSYGAFCDDVHTVYGQSRLFITTENPDLAVETSFAERRVSDSFGETPRYVMSLRVRNNHLSVDQNQGYFTLTISDSGTSTVLTPTILGYASEENDWSSIVPPGSVGFTRYELPINFFDGYPVRADEPGRMPGKFARICMTPLPEFRGTGDSDLSNNCINHRYLSDYTFETSGSFASNDTDPMVTFVSATGTLTNDSKVGYSTAIRTDVLARSGGSGPLTLVTSATTLRNNLSALSAYDQSRDYQLNYPQVRIEPGLNEPFVNIPAINLTGLATKVHNETRWEIQLDSMGGHPAFGPESGQLFSLADSGNAATELDETNNLVCLNCYVIPPTYTRRFYGVIVKLPSTANTDALFPVEVRAAARQLNSARSVPAPSFTPVRIFRMPEAIRPPQPAGL